MQAEAGVNILLVDDRPENLIALEAMLGNLGQNLVTAHSGSEALKRLLDRDFAVILLDVQMPEMDGFETAALIRARPRSHHTPIIFVTANSREDVHIFRGYSLGAVDFLFKPIVSEILRSKVNVFIDLYNKTEEVRRQAEQLRLAEQEAHTRGLREARQQWESQRLQEEMEREKEYSRRLGENYRRLQELEQLRDDLTHMIIHDLRTPMTSLLTGLDTLEMLGELNEEQRECWQIARDGGIALLGMVNDLLDISKMESGTLTLDLQPLEAKALLDQALHQVSSLVTAKEITLNWEVAPDVPYFEADGGKLRRALINLFGNALKFTPVKGMIAIDVRFDAQEQVILFSVQDTGEGIPEEAFGRIFEKFGQVESRKAGRRMSTGLGLTFCKMVTEAHSGRIWVESELGKGSTFSFTIAYRPGVSGDQVGDVIDAAKENHADG